MKKIIQITAIDGSMNKMLKLLNKRTKEAGFEIHCICSPGEGTKEITDNGYIYHPVNIDRKISPISNMKSIFKIYKIIKKVNPDIVHVHTPIASVLGRIAAKLAGVKNIIYTAHGFYFHEGMSRRKYKVFFNIEKYIGRYFTNWIFTQSEEDYQLAKRNNFLKNNNQYLHISNGIDVAGQFNFYKYKNEKNNIREIYNIDENDLLLTFVGRLVREKGLIELLNAYESLGGEYRQNIKLMIIGGISESERDKSLKDLLGNNNERNIILTGIVNNVQDYLYTSDVFILPSYREGMPRSIIEAMAMGNAIIATNIRGSREEVDHGINGLLVSVGSFKDISEGLIYLYENREILKAMQKSARDKATTHYNEEDVVSKQVKIFNDILNKSSS